MGMLVYKGDQVFNHLVSPGLLSEQVVSEFQHDSFTSVWSLNGGGSVHEAFFA
jgi:hypothetical protein